MTTHKRNNIFYILIAALFAVYLVLRYVFNDFSIQHNAWQIAISRCMLLLLLLSLSKKYLQVNKLFNRSESPYTLAVFRLSVFAAPAWFALQPYHQLANTLLRQWIDLPDADRVALPFMSYYSLHVPVSRHVVSFIQPIFLAVSVTSFLGLFTRLSTIIYAILAFYVYSICHLYGKPVNNHYLFWFPVVMACCDCGKVLSIDAFWIHVFKRKKLLPNRSARYTLAVNASIILLGIIYFFPGFWKIWSCGLDWVFRYNLRNIFYQKWIELNGWVPEIRLDKSEPLMAVISLAAVLFELLFVFWALNRKHSWLLLVAGIAFHYSVLYFTQIDFTVLLPLYACLIDWGNVIEKLKGMRVSAETNNLIESKKLSLSDCVIILLVAGNILFGFAKVVSWPFACFPTFDYMVPEKVTTIYYEGYMRNEFVVDSSIRKELNNQFSSYNVSARENRVLEFSAHNDYKNAQLVLESLLKPAMFKLSLDSVRTYKVLRPLAPINSHIPKDRVFLFAVPENR